MAGARRTTAGAGAGECPGFARNPDYAIDFEPSPRRVRVRFNGATVADTLRAHLMRETGHVPVYYFPPEDVRMDLFTPTDHHSHCPYKGDADYWTLAVGAQVAENVMWSYPDPLLEVAAIAGFVSFYWDRMESWWEEDEEIFGHARDPNKRVDVVSSHRPVKVVLGGEAVAETTNARFVFETNHQTRYYIPPGDVRMDLLHRSETRTRCPYKGVASYYSATVDGTTFDDIAWTYPDPIAECPGIKGLICFFDENVDATHVDGAAIGKVTTKWSRG